MARPMERVPIELTETESLVKEERLLSLIIKEDRDSVNFAMLLVFLKRSAGITQLRSAINQKKYKNKLSGGFASHSGAVKDYK